MGNILLDSKFYRYAKLTLSSIAMSLLLSITLVSPLSAMAVARAADQHESTQTIEPSVTQTASNHDTVTTQTPRKLALQDFVQHVVMQNNKLLMEETQWRSSQAQAEASYAIFEPEFISSLSLEDNKQRNSVEESLSRQLTATFSERNWNFDTAIETQVSSGGKFRFGYNFKKLSTSLTRSLTGEDDEYQMFLGLSATQPLLKNAGTTATEAGIKTAEIASYVAFQEYRQKRMVQVGKAVVAYWDYYTAQQLLQLRNESLKISEQLLNDNQQRYQVGKMAKTEVLEAQAGVYSRRGLCTEANHALKKSAIEIEAMLSNQSSFRSEQFTTDTPRPYNETALEQEQLIQQAFLLHPEYLAGQQLIKQTEIKIDYAQNQHRPELDLIASYGLNGLSVDRHNSWEQIQEAENDAWSVGLNWRIPLQGGIEGRSNLRKANLEKRRQLMALKEAETELVNQIIAAFHSVSSSIEQLTNAKQVRDIQHILLNTEISRLNAGKSTSRTVLEKEDDLRQAKETVVTSTIRLQHALVELDLASCTILNNYDVEIMESSI